MADNEVTVHSTADDMRPASEGFKDLVHRQLTHIYDDLDAIRERIRRLEALPGVAEALAAADKEGDK